MGYDNNDKPGDFPGAPLPTLNTFLSLFEPPPNILSALPEYEIVIMVSKQSQPIFSPSFQSASSVFKPYARPKNNISSSNK